ncbi:hypothetical protein I316_03119 [Kwoniella heveanensis BCC8398]|uniref:Uncharacterized protein n=1 Tax=Kwoniella heveanensis BCC8398 TaxID=1296120 RepID=A0A1B9GVN8_9TREE|nr:hypothetical protein I316_03119 [Kwoniella heveanensis BCC8398]
MSRRESQGSSGSGGGVGMIRYGKSKTGWGNLPVNILHNVLSFAQHHVTLDDSLHRQWGHDEKTAEIALAILQRIWLCEMRSVCGGWKHAVDSHAFWPAYTLLLDPSRPHSSTIEDFNSARLTPSTPSFPTLFHRSRHTTLRICLACRLNHPTRLGFYPAIPKRLTWTSRYGKSPTCDKHASHFCSECMKEFGTETFSPTYGRGGRRTVSPGIPMSTGLMPTNHGDTDGNGAVRPRGSLVCTTCRTAAITYMLRRMLEACSRGILPVRGLANHWLATYPVRNYVADGMGTAHSEAKRAIEEKWFQDHTRWTELRPTAEALQQYEYHMKQEFYRDENFSEDPRAKQIRLRQEAELRGDDWDGIETPRDRAQMFYLLRKWWRAREEETDEEDPDDEVETNGGLNQRYHEKLREGCLNDFINDRIRFGFWVAPGDEIRQHLVNAHARVRSAEPATPMSVHTPFDKLARDARHPFTGIIGMEYQPIHALDQCVGLIDVQVDPSADKHDPFLPPRDLLDELDELFEERLTDKINYAIAELMYRVRTYFDGDDDAAERYCHGLSVGELMGKLNEWKLWVPRHLADAVLSQAAQESARASAARGGQPRTSANKLNTSSPAKQTPRLPSAAQVRSLTSSPRIEMVEETVGHAMADYGITEVAFTPETVASATFAGSSRSGSTIPDDQPVMADNTAMDTDGQKANTLGKRKSFSADENSQINEQGGDEETRREEKRFKSSSPSAMFSSAAQVIPTTPHPELDIDGNGPTDFIQLAHGQQGTVKRKLPPSPETHHIDRSQRTVSPPAPPRFDLPLDRIKRDAMSDLEGSSAPVTPTPLHMAVNALSPDPKGDDEGNGDEAWTEGETGFGDEEEDEEMKGDEYNIDALEARSGAEEEDFESLDNEAPDGSESAQQLHPRADSATKHSGSRDSSENTSGTMPLTPESEPGSLLPSRVIMVGHKEKVGIEALKQPSSTTEVGVTHADPAVERLSQEEVSIEDVDVGVGNHSVADFDSDESASESDEGELEPELLFDNTNTEHRPLYAEVQPLRPVDILKRYARDNLADVPFIPLPPSSRHGSELSNDGRARWSLGQRTEDLLMETWYYSRAVLRECRCRICERARRKEKEWHGNAVVTIRGWN